LIALERPKASFGKSEAYPDLFAKAAALLELLCNNHLFVDGNNRVAYVATGPFLELNGFSLVSPRRVAEPFMLRTAEGKVSLQQAQVWLSKYSRPSQ
jgi:death-on-curing protein